jgi:hypothetical protein
MDPDITSLDLPYHVDVDFVDLVAWPVLFSSNSRVPLGLSGTPPLKYPILE